MARTESKSIQVHPNDEQSQINLMQKFFWNLLGSQEINVVDNKLERRGDTIYQTSEKTHYVKLTFSRDLDIPYLDKVKKLESEYNALKEPEFPKLFPVSIWLWVILALFYGIGIIGWIAYYFMSYQPKKERADKDYQQLLIDRKEILDRLDHLDELERSESKKNKVKPQLQAATA
jgi:hypothetical protein